MKLSREPEWVTVFESHEEYVVRIKLMLLKEAEIPAVIFDQRDSSYNAFGLLYLKVRREFEEEALKQLNLEHE